MKKGIHIVVAIVASIGLFWTVGNTTAFASKRIVKVAEPSLVKPVHLKVNYLYDTSEAYQPLTGIHLSWKSRSLTRKIKVSKKYRKHIFYVYRQATVKQGKKRVVYDYVMDKDKVFAGWVLRSKVKNHKSVAHMKEIKDIYNIVKNNATPWSFNQAKLVLGDINPSYPYADKRYSHNLGGGAGILFEFAGSHISDVLPELVLGMQQDHRGSLGEPPFDPASVLKNGRTMLLIYHYYQKKANFKIYNEAGFQYGVEHPETLTGREEDTGYSEGSEGTPIYGFMMALEDNIGSFSLKYNR